MYKIIERDGELYTIFDKEKYEALIMEDMKKEAREEGLTEGIETEKIIIAKNLKKIGISIDKIIEATGLSKDKIMML